MLHVRNYQPGDEQACLALLRRGHDADFSDARFRWLHEEAPDGPSFRAVCCDGESVVGLYAALPKRVRCDGDVFVGARDIDPVVDPAYRGRGVFGRLLDHALANMADVDFFFNFANEASRPGFLRRGWRVAGLLRDAVCQLGARKTSAAETLLCLATAARARRRPDAEVVRLDPAALLAWPTLRPAAPRGRLWVERSQAYLRWRYARSPLRRYEIYAEVEAGTARRAAVVRPDPETRRLHVLDVLSDDPDDFDLDPIVRALRRDHAGLRAVVFDTTPASARRRFLVNPLRRGAGYPLLIRQAPGGRWPRGAPDLGRFFLTHGDIEHL